MPTLQDAILLLGPTGAGKTPLGDWLDANGLWGRPCHHFDFGANLRATVAGGASSGFSSDEIHFLESVLAQGALLENASFDIATKVLDLFLVRRGVQVDHWLLLNGLPRHVGQAVALESRLSVVAVVQLECDTRVIRERLRRDSGGDRAVRVDDTDDLVARKLSDFEERTRPLVEHYRQRGARCVRIPVDVETQPRDVAVQLEALKVPRVPALPGGVDHSTLR